MAPNLALNLRQNAMEFIEPARYIAALLFTAGLMFAAWYAMRRFGPAMARQGMDSPKQLKVLEIMPLDGRRRLVRVQNGGREHLILLGGMHGDLLIDSGPTSETEKPE